MDSNDDVTVIAYCHRVIINIIIMLLYRLYHRFSWNSSNSAMILHVDPSEDVNNIIAVSAHRR